MRESLKKEEEREEEDKEDISFMLHYIKSLSPSCMFIKYALHTLVYAKQMHPWLLICKFPLG